MNSSVFDQYRSAMETIYGRLNYERVPDAAESVEDFKLSRMEDLLHRLGNPQLTVPTVHITGSKGKGSTATMVARIVQASGRKVGLFTSPHVNQFEERLTINQELVSQSEFVEIFKLLGPVLASMDEAYPAGARVTFFEIATALAWLHFARNQCDLAVMEVGLGGRLDSTNVCQPLVTAITTISRDHTRLLGDSLEEIAREKAGIIKQGVPVVTAVSQPGPLGVIREVAAKNSAELACFGKNYHTKVSDTTPQDSSKLACRHFDFFSGSRTLNSLQLSMVGSHQIQNAAVAIQIIDYLNVSGFQISDEQIRLGLIAARSPLRIEVVKERPLTIIDTAHNVASITALCESIKEVSASKKIVIFATSRDKEYPEMLSILDRHFDEIWLTRYLNNPRAVRVDELEASAVQLPVQNVWKCFAEPALAIQSVESLNDKDALVCYTGSFFLASEVKEILERQPATI